jgi:hypothetical protein
MAKSREFNQVNVVHAKGHFVPGRVIKQNEDGTIDVEITHEGAPMLITSSPRDDQAKQADSWHIPSPAPTAETTHSTE